MFPGNLFVHVPHLKERTDVSHNRVLTLLEAHFKSTPHMVGKKKHPQFLKSYINNI